jgi:hypothetical protein
MLEIYYTRIGRSDIMRGFNMENWYRYTHYTAIIAVVTD